MNTSFDIVFIGHFARDTIISPNGDISNSIGGGVTFGTLAAHKFNVDQNIGVFSEIGKDFDPSWLEIFDSKINLEGIRQNSDKSTHFKIQYFPEGGRKLTLESQASPLEFKNIPKPMLNSRSYMISSIANEISYDFVKDLLESTSGWIGVDIQGFIRNFLKNGAINPEPLQRLIKGTHKILELCGDRLILKASDDEINYIAQSHDVIESTKKIAKLGNFIVCTTLGPNGSLIKYGDEKMIHIPAFQPEKGVVDETGAGDCYLSVFLSEFIKSDFSWEEIKRCGYIASCAASFLIEENGPNCFGTKDEIQQRLKQMNIIPSEYHERVKYNFC